jgi:hypothetical protein
MKGISVKLVKVVYTGILGSFLVFINTAMAMPPKLPIFVMAREQISNILSGYTQADNSESGCQALFKENFPVANFDDAIKVINACIEIKNLTYAPDPEDLSKPLSLEAKAKMELVAHCLAAYLCNEIRAGRCELLSEFKSNWKNLSYAQKEVIMDGCSKPNDALTWRDYTDRNVIIWY